MILAGAEADGVRGAARGAALAAEASGRAYTPSALLRMLGPLAEAGGLRSWLRSLDSTVDPRLPAEVESEAERGYPSEAARSRELAKVAGWLARARGHLARLEAARKTWSDKGGRYAAAEADTRAEVLRQIDAEHRTVSAYVGALEGAEAKARKATARAG